MAEDLKLSHAREFTDIEDTTLDVWLALEDAGFDAQARAVLDSGLMAEHYTSLLDNDPDKRSQRETTQLNTLRAKMLDDVRIGIELLRARSVNADRLQDKAEKLRR